MPTEFVGRRAGLFGLALRTGVLTVLTLGFYRFWMKTRLRRYYWSSVRPGGVPLEYMGQPVEKLLGFLIAVVFLAFYIGIVNLLLVYGSLAVFHGNSAAYGLSFLGILPIWFFAQYRARRYVLARTRWRGIRFGLEQGAWGYSARACLYWALTLLSLGLLWPLKTFQLEKYRTDRTYFGQARLHQDGRWTMLYRPFLWVAVPWAVILVAAGYAALNFDLRWLFDADIFERTLRNLDILGQVIGAGFLAVLVLAFGALQYSVASFRLLTRNKSAGPLRLASQLRTARMLRIYSLGYFLTYFCVVLVIGLLVVALGLFLTAGSDGRLADLLIRGAEADGTWERTWFIALSIASYFAVFITWNVFTHVFVTLPRLRHYAETLQMAGTDKLPGVAQRERDEFAEAEGFAEALDLGAAI